MCPETENAEISFLILLLVSRVTQQTIGKSFHLLPTSSNDRGFLQTNDTILGYSPKVQEESEIAPE